MTPRLTTLALLIAVAPSLGAQTAPRQTITFDEAIRIALRQNITLKQANNAASLDAATVRQQRLALLPDLRMSTNTGQNYGRTSGLISMRRRCS